VKTAWQKFDFAMQPSKKNDKISAKPFSGTAKSIYDSADPASKLSID